jgi:O-antigen ligase
VPRYLTAPRLERLLAWGVFVTLAATPLLCLPEWAERVLEVAIHRSVPLHADSDAALLARLIAPKSIFANLTSIVLLWLLHLWTRTQPNLSRLVRSWTLFLACGVTGVACAAAAWPTLIAVVRPYTPFTAMLGVFWTTLICPPARPSSLRGACAAAVALAALVVLEEWGVSMPATGMAGVVGPAGTMMHRNLVGLTLAAVPALVLAAYASTPSDWRRIGYAAAFAIVITGVFATRSRTTLVACVLGLTALVVSSAAVKRLSRRHLGLLTALVGGALVLHSLSPAAARSASMADRLAHTIKAAVDDRAAVPTEATYALFPTNKPVTDAGMHDRLVMWKFAIQVIGQKPFLGVGIGEFATVWKESHPTWPVMREPHNLWLHHAAESGLPFLLIALLTAALLMKCIFACLRAPAGQRPHIQVGAASALTALFAASLMETIGRAVGPNLVAAALAGCIIGWASDLQPSNQGGGEA